MNLHDEECRGLTGPRPRTFSNASQLSQQSSKQNFPLLTSDSGLYTCSSNTSDCSLQLESDTDACGQRNKTRVLNDERLQLALQDVRKLNSELERLRKSEQWYKLELKQQKSTRLDDLEKIYTQERKFMQENQRLQKECVRLYEKCNELERELEKQNQESHAHQAEHIDDQDNFEENMLKFETEQQLALIKDQQQLISVLRKQKRSLLEDLKSLSEEKDEKVMELQRLLADLEFDNKLITHKCTQLTKERSNLEINLKQSDNKLCTALQEKMNLQKSIVDLKEQLEIQKQLLSLKENEIEHIQHHYTHKIQDEEDLDQVHKLSVKYQEEINAKTLEIINLKERLQELQDELEDMQNLQQKNEQQQRQIDQLNFSIETYRLELQELKASEKHKNKQLDELHIAMSQLIKDKELVYKTTVEQQKDYARVKQALKSTQEQYLQVQELYKKTQFKLELLEIEQGKARFQNERDQQEIEHLRNKLKEYLQQTTDLSDKVKYLENELATALKENSRLKQDSEQIKDFEQNSKDEINQQKLPERQQQHVEGTDLIEVEDVFRHKNFIYQHEIQKTPDDEDFLELQQQCERLQSKLDFIKDNHQAHLGNHQVLVTLNDSIKQAAQDQQFSTDSSRSQDLDKDIDLISLSLQGDKLQANLDKISDFLKEKKQLLSQINRTIQKQDPNEGIEKLVKENEFLKNKLCAIETEALTLQIKQDINNGTQKYTQIKENLENHLVKFKNLQENLLKNDGKLYKLQRNFKSFDAVDDEFEELRQDNIKLIEQLRKEQDIKTDLNIKLEQEAEKLKNLRQTLAAINMRQRPTKNQAIQCLLMENSVTESCDVKELKECILTLQQQQQDFLDQEASKKEERLHFLHQMMELQNTKMSNLQQHQKDWEDILTSLNNATASEEKTRKELELKRMELEELNQIFAEQNDELRKLEEFTTFLESKRQQEKEQLKQTFQKEINVMKQHLEDCREEIEKQKQLNLELKNRGERFQQNINEDYAIEVAEYKNEIRELKSRISKITEEKEDLLVNLKELEKQTKDLKGNKREAILMPDISLVNLIDTSTKNSLENGKVLKQKIGDDHLRILTKVLEAEYQRKMLRYDEHIHSLLINLKSLKKSLKVNEEKTARLSAEQLRTKEELMELQNTKRTLEELRLKYEQSQLTIKELKKSLDFERRKFELSDFGKTTQNTGTSYEVSNLIDDYKKLIQQSAIATKRPSTSAILDLIQRSNQYVPNLGKLENNVDGLRSELQNFLTAYSHKIPTTSLIATASLSVPPSLMDELRAASEGY